MEVYTIGFAKKRAAEFFGLLKSNGIRRLLDVRLNNTSQLAGFAKKEDLCFFLKELCGIEYVHEPALAPTQEILDDYKKHKGPWDEFERRFLELIGERKIEERLGRDFFLLPTVLLCSEPTAEHCHRRLILEYLQQKHGGLEIVHL